MAKVVVRGRLLKWGNSFGLRLTKAEVESSGLVPGQEAVAVISATPGRIDLSHIHFFRSGLSDVSERHDQYLQEGLEKKWRIQQRDARR